MIEFQDRMEGRITLLQSNYTEQMQIYEQQIDAKLAEFKREADVRHAASEVRHDASDARHDAAAHEITALQKEASDLRIELARQTAQIAAEFTNEKNAIIALRADVRKQQRKTDEALSTEGLKKIVCSAVQEELHGPRRHTARYCHMIASLSDPAA